LCDVQTKLANQQGNIKIDVGTMIGDMKKDIQDMMGNSIPENSINNIINQLSSMSGEIESNFSNIFTKINQIGEDVNTVKDQ
jgi:methyl-accepting chemotaxis protein